MLSQCAILWYESVLHWRTAQSAGWVCRCFRPRCFEAFYSHSVDHLVYFERFSGLCYSEDKRENYSDKYKMSAFKEKRFHDGRCVVMFINKSVFSEWLSFQRAVPPSGHTGVTVTHICSSVIVVCVYENQTCSTEQLLVTSWIFSL